MKQEKHIDGFECSREIIHGLEVSFANISTRAIADHLGQKVGQYATIYTGRFRKLKGIKPAVECLAECLNRFLAPFQDKPLLIIGIGDANSAFDALGPKVIRRIPAHMFSSIHISCAFESVTLLAPGTAVQNNISTAAAISGMVQAVKPSCVLLIDVNCTSAPENFSSAIHLSTGGLSISGSGEDLTPDILGVPILVITAPLVFSISTETVKLMCLSVDENGVTLTGTSITQEMEIAVSIISNGIIRAAYPDLDLEDLNTARLWSPF